MRAYVDHLLSAERTAKLRAVLRDAGLPGVAGAARNWVHQTDEYLRVRMDLGQQSLDASTPGSSLGIATGWGSELPALLAGVPSLPLEFCGRTPHRRFVLVMADGMPAHITWAFLPGDKSHFMALTAGQAEITDSHTLPRFRGRGIYGAVLRVTLAELASLGITTAFAHIRPHNRPSLATFDRAGFSVVSHLAVHRRFGRYTVNESDAWPGRDAASAASRRVGPQS